MMRRFVVFSVILLLAAAFVASCKKEDAPVVPGPDATPTPIPTRVCTPTGYGSPVVVAESPDAGASRTTALNLGSITYTQELKVQGGLAEGSDNSDFYQLTFDDYGYYTELTCFNTDGGSIDFDVFVYDSTGTLLASHTTGTYTVGHTCCMPNGTVGTYYIEVRRNAGSGPYALHIWAT